MTWKVKLLLFIALFVINLIFIDTYLTDTFNFNFNFFKQESGELQQDNMVMGRPIENADDQRIEQHLTSEFDLFNHQSHSETLTKNCKSKRLQDKEEIYQWVDENGILNLSNHKKAAVGNVEVAGVISRDKISLELFGDPPPEQFRSNLLKRIHQAVDNFAQVTDQSLVTPVNIKMRLFRDKASYKTFQESVAPKLAKSAGFYRSGPNESAVYLHPKYGLNTAAHESMHAINRAWFGSMSRWLNEGMAEVAEKPIRSKKNRSTALVNSTEPVSIDELINSSSKDWLGGRSSDLYRTSKQFVWFLHSQKPKFLARLLKLESTNGCNRVSSEDLLELNGGSIESLKREFDTFRKNYF